MVQCPRMKQTLTLLALSAGLCVTFNSCQSTDSDGFSGDFETATPINEYSYAADEIPIWLQEIDAKVPAGDTTTTVANRNDYPIPEPGATASTGSGSYGQVQPDHSAIAANDVVVEPGATTGVNTPAVSSKPSGSSSASSSSGKSSGQKSSSKPKKKKPVKTFDEPTMLIYKVRPGDNLSVIAKRCNTTVAQIRRDSGIKGDLIHPGQTIKIRYTPDGYKATRRSSSSSRSRTHTVKSGETISGIAAKYGLGYKQVLKANKMSESDAKRLRPGQKITIPGKSR